MRLPLSDELSLPLDAVTQTFAFLAKRGAGKTYGASKLAETMLEAQAQVVVLDPVGNWYGLRLAADGKRKGYPIPVFGGLRGDLPLDPASGALVADLIVDRSICAVLDVSMMRKGERKRFATDFGEQLFHRKKQKPGPLHLFVEEAQVFVPQRTQPDEARMLGAFEDLVKLGRNFGIGVTIVSQRPQAVNKEALSQTEVLIVLQTNGALERKAIRDWIVDQGLNVGELVDTLPGLKQGQAWVWSPTWLRLTKQIRIAEKKTFNASQTPEVGRSSNAPRELAPVDIEQIREAMASVLQQAERNDPAALHRRISQLEAELAQAKRQPAAAALSKADIAELDRVIRAANESSEKVDRVAKKILFALSDMNAPQGSSPGREGGAIRLRAMPTSIPLRRSVNERPRESGAKIKRGARVMLRALASRRHPLTKTQLGVLSGIKGSGGTFADYLSILRSAGLVMVDLMSEGGGGLAITREGREFLGEDSSPAPSSTEDLVQLWSAKLRRGALEMLKQLVASYPRPIQRVELGRLVGIEPTGGTFADYLSVLRSNGLAETDGSGNVRASSTLFPEAVA